MVLGLRANVGDRVGLLRNTYRESAVSLLPREFLGMVLIHPMRRHPLDQLHRLRQRYVRRQRQKDVQMVLGAADDQSFESVFPRNAANKGPKIRLHLYWDQVAPVFRRKNAVYEIRDVRVGHDFSVDPQACAGEELSSA